MTGNFNAGGQSILGNTTASANLKLESTSSNATKGFVNIQPNGGNVGIGTTTPAKPVDVYVAGSQEFFVGLQRCNRRGGFTSHGGIFDQLNDSTVYSPSGAPATAANQTIAVANMSGGFDGMIAQSAYAVANLANKPAARPTSRLVSVLNAFDFTPALVFGQSTGTAARRAIHYQSNDNVSIRTTTTPAGQSCSRQHWPQRDTLLER